MSESNEKIDWKDIEKRIKKARSSMQAKEISSREEITEILRKRAEIIAQSDDKIKEKKEILSILEFQLGQEKYAIKTSNLKEIIASDRITEIPCTPTYMYGVINIRGKIVTVIDLKKFLQLDYVGISDRASIVVATYNDHLVGFVADKINGIKNVELDKIQKSKPRLKKIKESYISGITNETVIILDTDKILSDKGILVNESII